MNTTQLECFVTVANFLNFSRAAEHLRITQPAVSHQINTLEDELGVKLFHRTSKSVRLTQEGYMFTQSAGEILKISEFSKARLKEMSQITQKRLIIGCRNTAELRLIVPALTKLRELNPEVMPILRLIPHDTLESLLSDGELHVIFTLRRIMSRQRRVTVNFCAADRCVFHPEHPLQNASPHSSSFARQAG
ncbi:MAG: LysR family transcriptional regulator [Oscillospiraceae bacterium]